jgi:hypothetical protein
VDRGQVITERREQPQQRVVQRRALGNGLAYRKLGFEVIEAHIVHDLDDANLLLAEHDENICRVQMTTGEARKLFAA